MTLPADQRLQESSRRGSQVVAIISVTFSFGKFAVGTFPFTSKMTRNNHYQGRSDPAQLFDVVRESQGRRIGKSPIDGIMTKCICCKRIHGTNELSQEKLCAMCQKLDIGRDKNRFLTVQCSCCSKQRRLRAYQDLPNNTRCKYCSKKVADQSSRGRR